MKTLTPIITVLTSHIEGRNRIEVRWLPKGWVSQIIGWFTDPAVFTEVVKPIRGWSFASQVICTQPDGKEIRAVIDSEGQCSHTELTGDFRTENSYFIDSNGLKHYVIKCETGKLGVLGEQVEMF